MAQWAKIKKEYFEGAGNKELSEKYNVPIATLESRIAREGWARKKKEMQGEIIDAVQEKIKGIADTAINVLDDILKNDDAKHPDKIAAARAILDISGLKSQKVDSTITGLSDIIFDVSGDKK